METVKEILFPVGGVLILDWIVVGRMGGTFSDFDYRYWPPTWQRAGTVILCMIMASASRWLLDPNPLRVWPLIAWAFVLALWLVVAVDDIARQRAIGYKKPPRYSGGD